jgi:ABC-2 type transport system permease protein
MTAADAESAVRRAQRAGFIVVKSGFGAASTRMLYGSPKEIEVGIDPARQAEAGMIEGLLMKHAAADLRKFLPASAGDWQPLKITKKDVARVYDGPRNPFDITFPQGVIWGLIGCMMSFGISLVIERTHGTLVRLRMAPLTRAQILGGKALACFASILFVEVMLLGVALLFGVRPTSYAILGLGGLSAAICFVGFMMLVASMGRNEQTAAGTAWAVLMPLSMIGGAMVPTFVMPAWIQRVSYISPIRWAMLAIEGGVWRNFTVAEMAAPCAGLIGIGIVCFALGTRGLREA